MHGFLISFMCASCSLPFPQNNMYFSSFIPMVLMLSLMAIQYKSKENQRSWNHEAHHVKVTCSNFIIEIPMLGHY